MNGCADDMSSAFAVRSGAPAHLPAIRFAGGKVKLTAVYAGPAWQAWDVSREYLVTPATVPWISRGPPGAAAIGDIDLAVSSPAFQAQSGMGTWASVPELAADPSDTGKLVAVETGMTSGDLATYNTAVSPAAVIAHTGYPGDCENPGDLAVVRGGLSFILACGSQRADGVYSTADASLQGSYPASLYPDAVAIDSSGDVAVGGSAPNNGGPYAPDVY